MSTDLVAKVLGNRQAREAGVPWAALALCCVGACAFLGVLVLDPDAVKILAKVFAQWIDSLADLQARVRILVRIERLVMGNAGDVAPVGEAVSELRIHYGPGYRVYFKRSGKALVILLAGGDKRTQAKDVRLAIRLAKDL